MAKPDRQQSPEIRRSEQAVQNWSFDEVYKVLSTVGLAEYANALYRLQADSDGNLKVNIASGTVDVDTTGLATETKQDDIITELQTIVPQTDALTDTQLRATPVPVSGTVTANLGTLNGAATAANQQTDALTDTELRATPVSVSGTVTATPTGTQNVDVTANTIGLATSAKQDTIIGHVDGVETAIASTNTKLDTVNTNLGTIDGRVDGLETLVGSTNSLLTTIDADTGNLPTIETNTDFGTVTGGGTETGALRVTVANNSTGVLSVDDNGSSLTVDGTVAATQSGTWTEANSAAIKTAVETIDNAISGNEMQVDVVGALPAGTNNIGDVDVASAVSSSLDHGSNRDIDTTAEQITSTSFACKFGVTVKADITNTGIIYVGNSDVTAGTTASTDGFPLSAGETLTLEVNNPNLLYAIASANNQIIYWTAV